MRPQKSHGALHVFDLRGKSVLRTEPIADRGGHVPARCKVARQLVEIGFVAAAPRAAMNDQNARSRRVRFLRLREVEFQFLVAAFAVHDVLVEFDFAARHGGQQ